MAKTPTSPTKTNKPKRAETVPGEPPRKLKNPVYRLFRLHKRIKGEALPGVLTLLKNSLQMLAKHWQLFLGITLLYGAFNVVLVQGFQVAGNISETKSSLDQLFTGSWGQLATGITIFGYLVGGSGSTASPAAGAYQFILALIASLAIIWTLRQIYAGHKVRVRDGLYQGMTPLVRFILVLAVVGLQLIPMAVGLMLYGAVTASGVAASTIEQVLWALLAFMLSVLSLYLISSSLFALYIVTLPDATPMQALRSARRLVANRRWVVLRKVIFLPIVVLLLAATLVIPIIMLATPVAPWIFFALTMLLLPVVHSYMYSLYRAML